MNVRRTHRAVNVVKMVTANSSADEKVHWYEWFKMSLLKLKNVCEKHEGCYRSIGKWYGQFEVLSIEGMNNFHEKVGIQLL